MRVLKKVKETKKGIEISTATDNEVESKTTIPFDICPNSIITNFRVMGSIVRDAVTHHTDKHMELSVMEINLAGTNPKGDMTMLFTAVGAMSNGVKLNKVTIEATIRKEMPEISLDGYGIEDTLKTSVAMIWKQVYPIWKQMEAFISDKFDILSDYYTSQLTMFGEDE